MNEWMVFLYRRPNGVQNSDKEELPERAHCVDIVSAVSQHSTGSPRRGEGHQEETPFNLELVWGHSVS
jgi:hypothetical protein